MRKETLNFFESVRTGSQNKRIAYFERLENEYGQNGYEAILRDLDFSGNPTILDLGCGSGSLLKYLAPHVTDPHYTGIDASARAIEESRADFGSPMIEFVQGDLHSLPFCDHSFDFAFSHMVFALIESPEEAAQEVARVLKPGGTFRLFTPAYWRLEDEECSRSFRGVMDTLNSIAPSPRKVGVGNDVFRSRNQIENVLRASFGFDASLAFEPSDFLIDLEPEDALQIFSLGMYQFQLIPDGQKGSALQMIFEKLRALEGDDGLVHMCRPMELITIKKASK